jgi:hypothetical protein
MPVGIEAWVTQIPPVTRAWLALAVVTSVAVVSTIRWVQHDSADSMLHHIAMPARHAASAIF